MNRILSIVVFAEAAITVTSCAPPPPSNAAVAPVVKVEAPPEKKPPRLKPSERGETSSISLSDFFELQQSGNVLIYDARPSVFYREGHIAGAINMPKSICDEVIKVREPELKAAAAAKTRIVVYCTNPLCTDARTVSRRLASRGYSSSIFSGGWDAWKSADLPTE